jgi:hypothetical protein
VAKERLINHAKAFDSLLALTPAREYYGSQIDDGLEPSEQWNRKKQTKEQKRAAKKAKLDPSNQKSALDVMKERESKRKRELGIEDEVGQDDGEENDEEESTNVPPNKRQKQTLDPEAQEAERAAKAAKRREARTVKREKKAKQKAKIEAKKARKQGAAAETENADDEPAEHSDKEEGDVEQVEASDDRHRDLDKMDLSGLAGSEDEGEVPNQVDADDSSVPSTPADESAAFDLATNHSETSSSSSIVPPTVPEAKSTRKSAQKPLAKLDVKPTASNTKSAQTSAVAGTESPKLRLPDIDQAELQERLRKRIEELRARRKADGPEGRPARSRQELLEQRRKKEEQRKMHKKELRRAAKEEEAKKREEQLRGSGSPMSMELFGSRPSPKPQDNNFSFSRVAFDDGTAADASLSSLSDPKKRKGPQDIRTALQAAEKKQSRLAGLDAEKRADIAEKDMWLNAKKHAHGERVRDDTSLLKKALKRKEKQKSKSSEQWHDRAEAVVKGKEMKQKRRESNLQKRRDDKGGGSKGKKKPSSSAGKGKKKARPGFEGRFKA